MSELKIGDRAPDFTLNDQDNNKVRLKDFRGKFVILYFYPKDETPGCTQEACDFRDYSKDFERMNVVILGLSKDSEASHTKFIDKYGLPFSLLSDPDTKTMQRYGVWKEKNMMGKIGMGVIRSTFIIDPIGKIHNIYPKVKVAGHVAAVLKDLREEIRR